MGKSSQGIHGNWFGRVGNIVGRVKDNRTILSIYQPNVANPQTAAQVQTRTRFTNLTKFFSAILAAIRLGFGDRDGYKYGSAFSAAVGYNMKLGIWSGTPATTIDFTRVMVSQGSIDLPYNPSASVDSNNLAVVWTDNTDLGNAKADDKIFFVLFNTSKSTGVSSDGASVRSDRQGMLEIPSGWSGDNAEAWMFAYRDGEKQASKSVHLGSFTL